MAKLSAQSQARQGTLSSFNNTTALIPLKDLGASPKTKPIRAIIRSELFKKSSATLDELKESNAKKRPPCRQSENVFDLDDTEKSIKKVIRIVRKQARPPSRHKTPPKALGLDLPPDSIDFYSMNSTPINQGLSMSQPLNIALLQDKHTKHSEKLRADSVKGKPTKYTNDISMSSRAWSAKQNTKNPPTIISKRKPEYKHTSLGEPDITNSPHNDTKRSNSRVKHNLPIFTNPQTEFLDSFA
jgi:hypothetical protein